MNKPLTNTELFEKTAKKLGLTFKRTPTTTNRSLFYITGNDKFYFGSARSPGFYPVSSRSGAFLSGNKSFTETALKKLKYKTLQTTFFDPHEYKNFTDFLQAAAKSCKKFPVILKPTYGLDGRGIKYIPNADTLALELLPFFKNRTLMMLQPIITQPEYRILVVNYKVELVHSKDFRSVTGDGKTTLHDLLKPLPKADKNSEYIKRQSELHGYTPQSILPKGVTFHTHIVKNSSFRHFQTSGFPKNLTAWATGMARKLAIPTIGIDLFIKGDVADPKSYTVIELNSNPGLAHYYKVRPGTTHPERICEKVLKQYFKV